MPAQHARNETYVGRKWSKKLRASKGLNGQLMKQLFIILQVMAGRVYALCCSRCIPLHLVRGLQGEDRRGGVFFQRFLVGCGRLTTSVLHPSLALGGGDANFPCTHAPTTTQTNPRPEARPDGGYPNEVQWTGKIQWEPKEPLAARARHLPRRGQPQLTPRRRIACRCRRRNSMPTKTAQWSTALDAAPFTRAHGRVDQKKILTLIR